MQHLFHVVLVLHIASAAVLFGGAMGLTRSLRQHLSSSNEIFLALARDAVRKNRVTGIFSILTLLTGLMLIFLVGGFANVRFTIHIALTLMLVAIAVGAVVMTPQISRLVALAERDPLDRDGASKAIKRLTIGQGIIHFLWLVILALMVSP